MKEIKQHYKNLIIGFGKGGKTLASYLAKQGEEVVLVERSEEMYGGTCINVACIPTKSLITNGEKNIPYGDAWKMKNELTAFLREKNFNNLNDQPFITIINGTASFVSAREVKILLATADAAATVSAERIFINTGTEPFIPNIAGVKNSARVFTSASLMEQPALPEKLIIIGGGFIGLEFADMYARFGTSVTVLDQAAVFLPGEDRDIADELYKILTEKEISIRLGVTVQQITDTAEGVIVQYTTHNGNVNDLTASAVLMATGRKPNADGLNLAAAGIQTDSRGFIRVDDNLQTNVKNIWALGDIHGGPQFTHMSLDDFRIIRDQLSGGHYTSVTQRKTVASSVFVTPPLAHAGLREWEAKEKGYTIKVARLAASAIPRARILGETRGLLKSVIDKKTSRILGCTLLCAEAGEMINTIRIAMQAGLDYQAVRDMIFTHPSMTESFNDLYSSV